jgi:hypothetical protein
MRSLNTLSTSLLAATATLAASGLASAGTFGGMTVSTGALRCATSVSQGTNASLIATNWVEIDYCSGYTEYLTFTPTSLTGVQAIGANAAIYGNVSSATVTDYKLIVHTPGDDVISVRIMGSSNTKMGFDKRTPSPGTAGSNLGTNFTPGTMTGAWIVYAHLTDVVALCPAAPQSDLYASLHIRFSDCFRYGDYLGWKIDTDRVN